MTYNIPIEVSGASPDAKALDDDLDAPLLDMQQLDETPVSWVRRGVPWRLSSTCNTVWQLAFVVVGACSRTPVV